MRSSLLPRRSLRRVCDACKQQQRNYAASKNFSRAATLTTFAPDRALPSCQPAELRAVSCRGQGCNSNTIISQSKRSMSSSAASSASAPSDGKLSTETVAEAEQELEELEEKEKKAKTHYDLFPQTLPQGPPPKGPFAIDTRALRREFLTLQATAHPDLVPPGPEKRRAEAASARINEAYRTLAHPLLRAQYLLSLRGIDVANDETGRVEDPSLLMLVLETREMIEEAQSEEELEPIREENEGRIRESEGRLAKAFEEGDEAEARREVTRLRYWINVRESIQNWERGKPIVLEH
ncbi:Co-chaperone Hsc20 [Hypoxylon sp. FL0890]|nr:Co-chaperone Hsc20 [Hypoxylon sp. FL0890]